MLTYLLYYNSIINSCIFLKDYNQYCFHYSIFTAKSCLVNILTCIAGTLVVAGQFNQNSLKCQLYKFKIYFFSIRTT